MIAASVRIRGGDGGDRRGMMEGSRGGRRGKMPSGTRQEELYCFGDAMYHSDGRGSFFTSDSAAQRDWQMGRSPWGDDVQFPAGS